jgi:NAD(P)-dependent dehydrogenase (short-subunit alcohol dehydrogenase family)
MAVLYRCRRGRVAVDVGARWRQSGPVESAPHVRERRKPSREEEGVRNRRGRPRQLIPGMKSGGGGNIVFTGATASRRGNVMTAAFAPAKAAQRSLAESMARALWPAGIHVSIIIVDGVVDLPRSRERMPAKPDSFFLKPEDLADTAFFLTQQKRSAWSFEVEARPFGETW